AAGKSGLRPRLIVVPSCALIGVAVVQTGSRGGLLALGAGLLAFALTGKRLGVRIRNAIIVLLALGFFTFITIESEVTKRRFESAVQKGELARRERIYPTAWQMIQEKPLFGWGPVTSSYELGRRLGHPRELSKNAHNLVLEVLNVTGLAGAALFFTGTLLAALAAWKARNRAHGYLPAALVLTVLAANMSGLWHFNKLHWIVIAYALASLSHPVVVTLKRRVARTVTAPPLLRASAVGMNRRRQSAPI
ncbi:MAG TPA: O-antigen ligase family protein, partial [Blastocatellia bacterium]|nr:O-antigen ligase family protein [Blastocatellia bacterium]